MPQLLNDELGLGHHAASSLIHSVHHLCPIHPSSKRIETERCHEGIAGPQPDRVDVRRPEGTGRPRRRKTGRVVDFERRPAVAAVDPDGHPGKETHRDDPDAGVGIGLTIGADADDGEGFFGPTTTATSRARPTAQTRRLLMIPPGVRLEGLRVIPRTEQTDRWTERALVTPNGPTGPAPGCRRGVKPRLGTCPMRRASIAALSGPDRQCPGLSGPNASRATRHFPSASW